MKFPLLILLLAFQFSATSQQSYRLYKNTAKGFSFMYPSYWTVKQSANDGIFIANCEPGTPEEAEKFKECFENIVFRIGFYDNSLDSTLSRDGYVKINGNYLTSDRVNDSVWTKNIKGTNWKGIYHLNVCGIKCDDTGFHAAAGECEYIYFSRKNKTVMITTNGRKLGDIVLTRLITTFRFE